MARSMHNDAAGEPTRGRVQLGQAQTVAVTSRSRYVGGIYSLPDQPSGLRQGFVFPGRDGLPNQQAGA